MLRHAEGQDSRRQGHAWETSKKREEWMGGRGYSGFGTWSEREDADRKGSPDTNFVMLEELFVETI